MITGCWIVPSGEPLSGVPGVSRRRLVRNEEWLHVWCPKLFS
jgi:hypothetical protein